MSAQENSQELEVKQTIKDFFQAFNDQDSTKLKAMTDPLVYMQSIAEDSTGNSKLETEDYLKFLKSRASIPNTTKFEERLLSYIILE